MNRKYIHNLIYGLKVGESVVMTMHLIDENFPSGFPSIYNNSREALLGSLMGSGCGAFRASCNMFNATITVSRHEESDKIYYVDPDRADRYTEMMDGTLELKKY